MTRSASVIFLIAAAVGCSGSAHNAPDASGIDSLNARLERAYGSKDPAGYGVLFTDSGTFEWPAVNTVKGRPALEAMAKELWPGLAGLSLRVIPGSRHATEDHATEFGAFEESWNDSTGKRMTEYGRYASYMTRQPDKSWLIDRWLGFEDSVRTKPIGPSR
jgi:hypothetical protein